MATKAISQRISLEGSEDIRKKLEELGKTGAKAFTDIQAAAQKTNFDQQKITAAEQALDRLAQAGTKLASQFQQLGQAAQQTGQQIAAMGTAGTQSMQQLGGAAQQTSQQVAAVGVAGEQSVRQIGAAAQQSSTGISSISTAFQSVLVTFGIVSAAVSGLAITFTAMGKSASEAVLAIGRSADAAGASIENFSRARTLLQQFGLSAAEAEAVIKRLGTVGKSTFDSVRQSLSGLTGGFRGLRFAEIAGKDIPKFLEGMRGMANVMVNGRYMLDATTRALLNFGIAFNPVTGQALRTTQQLTQLADQLAKIQDPAKQAAAVNAIFGESLGKVLLPALRRGTSEFVNMIGTIDRLRLSTTAAEREIAGKFMQSWNLLQSVLRKNNEEIGILIAKPITPFINRFAEAMRNNETVIRFFEAALKAITPVLDDLLKLLEGRSDEVKLQWIQTAQHAIQRLGDAVVQVFRGVIVPAFETTQRAAFELATTLNRTFGTDFFSGPILALGIALTGLIGVFQTLGLAALAAFADTSQGFNPIQQGLAALGVDVEAMREKFFAFWEDIKKLFSGREGEVDNRWLVDLKNALVEFATSLPGVIIEVVGLLTVLSRIVGPGRLATVMALQFTGILQGLAATAIIVGQSFVALGVVFGILAAIVGAPLAAAILAIAGALAYYLLNQQAVNKAIDEYNAQSYDEANRRSAEHYAQVASDFAKIKEVFVAVNKAIDDYNKKSYEEASQRSAKHYQDVESDFAKIKEVFVAANAAIDEYNAQSYDEANRRSAEHYAQVASDFAKIKAALATFVGEPLANAWQWIVETFNTAVAAVSGKMSEITQAITTWVTAVPGAAWQWIVDTFDAAATQLSAKAGEVAQGLFTWVTEAPAGAWQWIVDTFNSAIDRVLAKINQAWQALKNLFGFGEGGLVAKGGGGTGFARGGVVGGRGTGTSDSNLAWVSRGEYIMPARAVQQPGVLEFLAALRRSGGNLTRVLDGMGRFALGGMVPARIPAFAEGGLNSGMSNVTIQFPGLPAIGGLRASSDVVDELRKAAALAQVRSGGRKPSRYS